MLRKSKGLSEIQRAEVESLVEAILAERRVEAAWSAPIGQPELARLIPDAIAAVSEVARNLVRRLPGPFGVIGRAIS